MRKNLEVVLSFVLVFFFSIPAYSQSPYALSPDWLFGFNNGGRLTFPNGNFPVAGAPTPSSVQVLVNGIETSTSVCNPDGSLALFSTTMQAYNGSQAGAASWTTNIRDINNTDHVCAGSSTGGGVAFPNPAGGYYLVVSNDLTGGACGSKGFNLYRFTGSGSTVAYAAGPTGITGAGPTEVTEALTVGTDGTGGYWLIAHLQTGTNTFRVWHITAGGFSAYTDYTVGTATPASGADQSYIKLSPCQDKVAFTVKNTVVVHDFDRTTGVVGTQRLYKTGGSIPAGDGLEFSPDGTKLYLSGLGTAIQMVNIGTGTVTAVAGGVPTSWTMQLGPDGNLYTSNFNSSSVIQITNLNGTASVGPSFSISPALTYAGLINIAWLSPQTPAIPAPTISTCDATVQFNFKNYFSTNIPVNTGTIVWNFGDGTGNHTGLGANPTYTYPASASAPNTYTITVTFNDSYCGHTWTASRSVSINCPTPVTLISFAGSPGKDGVDLFWQTAMELNNHYFDIQRSTDGINFESIGHVDGAGDSKRLLSYKFTDKEITSGKVYYRLDQYDYDGGKSSSRIVVIDFGRKSIAPVTVAPNPFSSSFVLTKQFDESAVIYVYDIYGRVLEQMLSSPEEKFVTLGQYLSNGTYILKYVSGNEVYTLSVEKK